MTFCLLQSVYCASAVADSKAEITVGVLPTLAGYGTAEVTSLRVSGPRRASAEP